MQVVVSAEELERLRHRVAGSASMEEPGMARLLVTVSDGTVAWVGTDAARLARQVAGEADGDGSFCVPLRAFTLAARIADRREAPAVCFSAEGAAGRVRLPGVELPFDASAHGFPDVGAELAGHDAGARLVSEVTMNREDLLAVIHAAALPAPWLTPESERGFAISIDPAAGRFRTTASWDGHPPTEAVVHCTATLPVRLAVNPRFLFDLVCGVDDDDVTLLIPDGPGTPIRLQTADGFTGLLMPIRTGVEPARPAFEAMLTEVFDLDGGVVRDDDGDYPIHFSDEDAVYFRLVDADPHAGTEASVRVFAILACSVDPTPELLTELNDLNRQAGFARLFWADRCVYAGTELLLSTLDPASLGHAFAAVSHLADTVAPMLQLVHGAA